MAHMNPTPSYSICIWAHLSLLPLEYGGWAANMETHPYEYMGMSMFNNAIGGSMMVSHNTLQVDYVVHK